MNILVLDDDDTRHQIFREIILPQIKQSYNLFAVKTVHGAKGVMSSHKIDMMLLDHDLGRAEDGRTFCRWTRDNLTEETLPPKIIIHSHNHQAAREMENILRETPGGMFVEIKRIPFSSGT
jgi:CheY-like chemotaxis protein